MKNSICKSTVLILIIPVLFLAGCTADSNGTGTDLSGNIARFQGTWHSLDDTLSYMVIQKDTIVSYYEDKKISTETIEFINNAEDRKNDPEGQFFIVKGEFDAMIYYIINISDTSLEYSWHGRGNSLRFSRIR